MERGTSDVSTLSIEYWLSIKKKQNQSKQTFERNWGGTGDTF